MDKQQSSDGFWAFSTAFYDQPGVKKACLTLQDDVGADVNLVLLCAWTMLDDDTWDEALAISAARQPVIQTLRAERQARAKSSPAYESALAAELAAEKMEQGLLEALVGGAWRRPGAETIEVQLRYYAVELGVDEAVFMITAYPIVSVMPA
ncbi:MAG: TIGR02444 family protein [Proteobacteria bacterium]|jgi:uncharacterized protein (TIGR02444 family)|nr:TIGR02444 family protein [Pseudomonadota bacterium]